MQPTQSDISARVKAQYERFPYPNYSLLVPLRTQEAYASNALFAARVLEQGGRPAVIRPAREAQVLLAGCGDIYPYMATFWEPRRHRLTAVDLSEHSLRRAKARCLPRLRDIAWRPGNLEDPALPLPEGLAHIDSYGVLHHLANPARVLRRFATHLLPGGTARIMVYNSAARQWIRHVQQAFSLLGLSAFRTADLERGLRLLDFLAAISPALRQRLAPLRETTFGNASRLVDTFFHAREARLDLAYWLRAIEASGLALIGVFDRYAELDDLPNPLLVVPGAAGWQERIADRRFENNLELYLTRPGIPSPGPGMPGPAKLPSRQGLRSPPKIWFAYPETSALDRLTRYRLWWNFLDGLRGRKPRAIEAWAGRLPPMALQRLGRLGALFPDDFQSPELRDLLLARIHEAMEPPDIPDGGPVRENRDLRAEVEAILKAKGRPGKYLDAIMDRFVAAQAK